MNFYQVLSAVLCVLAISVGQILFKWTGLQIQAELNWFSWKVILPVGLAAIIYGGATLLWINLLRQIELNKVYIFMSLTFFLVPMGSFIVFREHITLGYLVGVVIVVIGLIVATNFS